MMWCKEKEAETKGQEVRKVLEGLGLSQYADSLIEEHGFERIAWFNNVQDLPTKCGVKVGHAEAIMLEVRKKAGVNKKATTSPVSVESDTEKDEVLDDEDRPARKNKKKRARLASANDVGNYVPSSWTEIERVVRVPGSQGSKSEERVWRTALPHSKEKKVPSLCA